jgi:hypothetical protein
MVWLLDHGDGPLEGASGPQSVVMQLIDSLLGVRRSGTMGKTLAQARRYMLPEHRELLELLDESQTLILDYVLASESPELLEAYNGCLELLMRWRKSHKSRGAMYMSEERGAPSSYASTGLVVSLNDSRVATFEKAMEGHLEDTRARVQPARCPFVLAS